MEAFEHDCILGLSNCSDTAPCPMHDMWGPVRADLLETLRSMTVADLAAEMSRKKADHGRLASSSEAKARSASSKFCS